MQRFCIHNDLHCDLVLAIEPEGDEFIVKSGSAATVQTPLSEIQTHVDIAICESDGKTVVSIWSIEDIAVSIDGKEALNSALK